MRVSGTGIDVTALREQPQQPQRLAAREWSHVYQRVFAAADGTGTEAKSNRQFQDLWLRFVSTVAQFGRQKSVESLLGDAPSRLSTESVRRAARDLALAAASLAPAGAAARDQWQVIDQVATLELGGARNPARYRATAEIAGSILEYVAAHPDATDSAHGIDDWLQDSVEQWLAAAGVPDGKVEAMAQPDAQKRAVSWPDVLQAALGLGDSTSDQVRERLARGAVMFSGPAGTGKTLAAHWLATSVGQDVLRVDLTAVVSKYIGETEKNLERLFGEAERSNAVLFFDEADALFGKRTDVKDSHDRYANQEVSLLLQRIERYDGIAIVATNSPEQIDPAVLERLHAVVLFPLPPRPGP